MNDKKNLTERMDAVEKKVNDAEQKFKELENKIEYGYARIKSYDQEILALGTPKELKFKIGDRIESTIDKEKGIGTIVSTNQTLRYNGYGVRFDSMNTEIYYRQEQHLVPYVPEPEPKFKVGDYVELASIPDFYKKIYPTSEGSVGQILNVARFNKRIAYCVQFPFKDIVCDEKELQLYEGNVWEFTDAEKCILRLINEQFKWIARDFIGSLYIYRDKPHKVLDVWTSGTAGMDSMKIFNNSFQSIKFEDDEPCEFRKFI